jgi:addiction module HigA family antidote
MEREDEIGASGRILRREIEGRSLSADALAIALRTQSGRVTDILNGTRGISPETAMRLARYFGNSPRFWLNLQTAYSTAPRRAQGVRNGRRAGNSVQSGAVMAHVSRHFQVERVTLAAFHPVDATGGGRARAEPYTKARCSEPIIAFGNAPRADAANLMSARVALIKLRY